MERLQKVIAASGYCSRRKAEELIKLGQVKVNGKTIKELGFKASSNDQISVNNKLLKKERKEYYILYKPKSIISSTNDEKGRLNVVDLIEDSKVRLYPVGRLDYDTTGFLILTNDGEFANMMMHPSNKIKKTYIVYVDGMMTLAQIAQLENGVMIDDYKTKPAKAKIIKKDVKNNNCVVRLMISEGKNHQVKKMISSLGLSVRSLHRDAYGHLNLKGLVPGQYRKLTSKERSQLIELAENGFLDY